MKAPRKWTRTLDKCKVGVPSKAKRAIRRMRRDARGEVYDDRYPETTRGEKLVQLHKARARRRAKGKVAKQSRKRNR